MSDEIKSFSGLGFNISVVDEDERPEYACSFHKLDEDRDPYDCAETPFVFVGLDVGDEGLAMCKRHFSLFVSDMLVAISTFQKAAGGIADEPKMFIKEGGVLTYPAFIEMFMDAKENTNGGNA